MTSDAVQRLDGPAVVLAVTGESDMSTVPMQQILPGYPTLAEAIR